MAESYQVDVYKCPNCASVVSYDPRTKKYVCESCGKQFAPFMPGFLAECYTESYEKSWERVKDLLLQGTLREIGPSFGVPIETPRYDIFSTDPEKHLEQVLLPVWLFTISYGEEKYLVGVNGQTGSVAMNCPVDDGKRNELLSKKMRHSVFVSFLVSIPLAIAAAALAASVNSSPPSIFHFLILPLVVIAFACSVGAMLGAGNARQEITGNMEHVKSMQDIDRYMLKRSVSYSVEKDTEMSPLDPDKSLGTHTSIATGDIRIGEK